MEKELINLVLDCLKSLNISYGDVRGIRVQEEVIRQENGKINLIKQEEDLGIGIRVIKNGAWGFAATAILTKDEILKTAKLACQVALASAKLKKEDVRLSEEAPIKDKYQTPIEVDPFKVPLEEKINLLIECDDLMKKIKGIKKREGQLYFYKKEQFFASTEDAFIEQIIYHTGGYIAAQALKGTITGERSYPGMLGGQYKAKGYEFIKELKLKENCERITEEAVALTTARECPAIETDIILDGTMVAIQIHETVGHPTELDRVLGTEVSLAGTSHLTIDKLNNFQFGSEIVNITADATTPYGLGTFGYDDEGIKAQKVFLIKNGIFCGYLTSRETAVVLNQKSNGTMRASSWTTIPLIRMTNINLLPGTWEFEDLWADTKEGVYFETAGAPSIDDKRLNYSISSEIGWIIKNGKKTEMIRRPFFSAISYELWRKCDAIGNEKYWEVLGVHNCGKGDPIQVMHVGHGASPARFRKVKIGG